MEIRGKVALITGASEGIGAACADAFRRRGARLSLTARSQSNLERVAAGDALITAGDICDDGTRRRAVERTLSHYGSIDILVNNAGAGLYSHAWAADERQIRGLMELNFFAPLALIQLVAPHMRREHRGTIVNVGSIAGKMTLPWMTMYSASKYALGSLTDGLRMELRRDGIHTMIVCPGYVKTDFQKHLISGEVPRPIASSKRFAITAEQCAEAIARGVERDAPTVVTPWTGWLMIAAYRLCPRLIDAQLEKIDSRRNAQ